MNSTAPAPGSGLEEAGQGLQSLVRMLRVLFFLLRILIILTFVYVLFSGVFFVRENEEAMLFRFGRLRRKGGSEILKSGKSYWAWPYPIDRVKRVPVQSSLTLETKELFWPIIDPNRIDSPKAPTDPGTMDLALRPGEGGYLLTGDANIMQMRWSITYRVSNAKKYYLDFYDDSETKSARSSGSREKERKRGAEAIITNVLGSAVLAEVATWPVESVRVVSRDDADGGEKETLAAAVRHRATELLDELDLGIEVQGVSLIDVQPPPATQAAFNEVNDAAQEGQTLIDRAHADYNSIVPRADGEAAKIIAEAKGYRTRVVESVKAEKAYFETVLAEYEKNPETMLVALYTDAIRDVLNQVDSKYIVHSRGDGRTQVRLLLGPEPEKPRPPTPEEMGQN